jgi:2'-5' RNA ligase
MKQIIPTGSARLFIALWPDQAIRNALLACREQWSWPNGAHLAHANSLHVTLHFLGNVPMQTIPALIDALRVPFEPFTLTLDHSAGWHHGVAVLEPSVIPAPLSNLHTALGTALCTMALPVEERRYRPHVTFARRAIGAQAPEVCTNIEWPVNGYALMQSHLSSSRGYEVLQSYR